MAESKKVTKYADEHLYKKIIEGDKTVAQLKEEVEEDVASLQESINKTTQSFADEAEVQEKQASLAVKDYAYPDNLREKFKYNNPCFELHFNKGISVSTEFEGIQMENNDDLLTNYNADFIDCSSDCYASYSTDMGCLTLFASPGVDTDNGYALWYSKRAKDYTYPKFDTSCGITIDTSIKFKSLPISDDISTDIQTQGALLEVDAAAGDLPVSLYFKFLGCEESVEGETHNLAIGYAPTVTRGEDSSGAYNNVSYDYITTKIDVGENAKFHRFTFVYDSAKQLSIYVDGELLPNTPIDLVDCFLHEGSTSLNMVRFLACANSNYQNQLEVLFDDFAIYNGFKAIECVEQEDNSLSFNVVEINNIPEGGLVGTLRYMNCYTLNEYLSTLLGILEDKDYFMMTDESDLEESITSFINKIITQHIHSSHSSYIKELEEKAKELLTKITYSNNIEDIIPIPYSWDGVNTEESNRINQILEYGNVEDPNYSPIGYPFAWTNSLILFYPGINPIHYVFSVPGKVTNARLTSNEWTHYVFHKHSIKASKSSQKSRNCSSLCILFIFIYRAVTFFNIYTTFFVTCH